MKTLERGRTKKSLLDEIWSKRAIYLLISPFFLFYAVFGLYPIVYSLILSFHKWSGSGEMQYIGLLNYQVLLKDPNFSRAVLNTLSIWCLNTIPMVIMALIIAFLLNLASLKFKAFFRAVYFLPNITSTVAVSIVFSTLFANNYGLVNFALLGGRDFPVSLLLALCHVHAHVGGVLPLPAGHDSGNEPGKQLCLPIDGY